MKEPPSPHVMQYALLLINTFRQQIMKLPQNVSHISVQLHSRGKLKMNTYERNKPLPTLTCFVPLDSELRALLALIFQSRFLLMRTILGVPMEEAISKPFQSLQCRGCPRALVTGDLLVPCHLHTPATLTKATEKTSEAPLRDRHVLSFLPAVFANHDFYFLLKKAL